LLEYCLEGQFTVWGRLLEGKPRRGWEWRLHPFAASTAIRPPRANGCRSKSGKREQRARRRRQGFRFGALVPGEGEIHRDSLARAALRSFLVREWLSHFPRTMASLVFLLFTNA